MTEVFVVRGTLWFRLFTTCTDSLLHDRLSPHEEDRPNGEKDQLGAADCYDPSHDAKSS